MKILSTLVKFHKIPTLALLAAASSLAACGGGDGCTDTDDCVETSTENEDGELNDDVEDDTWQEDEDVREHEELPEIDPCPSFDSFDGPIGPGCVTMGQTGVDDLEILPGTTIKVLRDGYLTIRGELTALGTAEAPIVFESADVEPLAGDWGCIHFDGSSESEISHLIVSHAGSPCQSSGWRVETGILLGNAVRTFTNIRVEESAGDGLQFFKEAYNTRTFADVSFHNIAKHSLVVEPVGVQGLGAPITLDEDEATIWVDASSPVDFTQDTTWKNLGIPYEVVGELTAHNTLTVEPGVEIRMSDEIHFSLDATLQAVGTPEEPIRWTSREAEPAAGDWGCLRFLDVHNVSTIHHNIIEYSGICLGGSSTGIFANSSELDLEGLSFAHIEGPAIEYGSCDSVPSFWCDFESNNVHFNVQCGFEDEDFCSSDPVSD